MLHPLKTSYCMRIYKIPTTWLLLFLLLASCSNEQEEYEFPVHGGKLREISFTPVDMPELKSSHTFWQQWHNGFIPGDAIGIFVVETGGNTIANNKCFIFDGERFTPAGEEDCIFVRNRPFEVYACYPFLPHMYNHEIPYFNFTVSPYQDKDGGYHDGYPWELRKNNLMTAVYKGEPAGDVIPLTFRHRMALVGVDIYHGLDREVSEAVLPGKYITSYYNMADPKNMFMPDTIKSDIAMYEIMSGNGVTSYKAYIPEQVVNEDSLLFRLSVSGREYEHYAQTESLLKGGVCNYYRFTFSCTIGISAGQGGTVSGGGTYSCGDQVMVKAVMDTGYDFTGWYENGEKVSGNQYYIFMANGNRTLEARFKHS